MLVPQPPEDLRVASRSGIGQSDDEVDDCLVCFVGRQVATSRSGGVGDEFGELAERLWVSSAVVGRADVDFGVVVCLLGGKGPSQALV